MTRMFSSYPEIIFIDATYKLLDLCIPLYLMLAEDSNGNSSIICTCLLVSEDQESISWMIATFKKRNPRWRDIRVLMADKNINESYLIKTALPEASLACSMCCAPLEGRYHMTKWVFTSGQRQLSLDLLQKLAYSSSNEDYETVYKELEKSARLFSNIFRRTGTTSEMSGYCIKKLNVGVF